MKIFIIIDALDECSAIGEERNRLVLLLESLKMTNGSNMHLLFTSRLEPDLNALHQIVTKSPIDIRTSQMDNDIRMHIQNELTGDPVLKTWPLELRVQIEKELIQGACGM